jgi:hypothetical protein
LRGYPTSSNGASSFHLHWGPAVELSEVAVTLEVVTPPGVDDLHFWALQASFAGPGGITGAGHLGLQWHSSYPGRTAVNWGGYDASGTVLAGTESSLPSALDNPHTRNFEWIAGVPYRLRIYPAGDGRWSGEVSSGSGTVTVRSLYGGGDRLVGPMVWSEVFARCEAPPSAVAWSQPAGRLLDGSPWEPDSYGVTYQREEEGGCSNTDVVVLPHGVAQITGVTRTAPPGSVLAARPPNHPAT